jgi:type I phosphodiesterase/nucleotide pyrophosphatase
MPIRWAYLKRVLAGAIFGLYMAHLLYFLNPQVDVTPGRLVLVTLVYGAICGLLFGSALWLLRALRVRLFGKPDTSGAYRAHGFGFVVLAAFVSSLIYWIHLTAVQKPLYLPVGAVRILSKATNTITLTAFVLLVLWFLERNADRNRSRALFLIGVLVIAASAFSLYERRDSYRTETRSVVVANVGTVAGQRPAIVIAIRNLPYDWIVTLAGEGNLPFFEQSRQRAYFARIEPFPTTSSKALWASLATGKLPYRHGVTGRFSYRTPLNGSDPRERFLLLPSGVGFRVWGLIPPVKRISAQLPAGDALPFWTLFERLSFHAAVVSWPGLPPLPPAPRDESAVAQRFNGTGKLRKRILDGLAADENAIAALRANVSRHAYQLDVAALEGFADAQRAMHIYSNDLPAKSTVKGSAVRAYAEQLDRMIGALARDFPDHLLVVVSPNGPAPPQLPSTAWFIAREAILNEDPGADDGFVLMTGAGTTHRENAASGYVVDVVPTVLFAAGLPVARDMDGRVLTDAFDDEFLRRSPLSVIQTYEAKQIVVRRGG